MALWAQKQVRCWSYLAPLFLPEDCRLGIAFGLTREGGGPSLGHDLVPWPDHKLGRSWSQKKKKRVTCYYMVIATEA